MALPRIINNIDDIVRGVKKSDFFNSVSEFKNTTNSLLANQAWDLWKQEKWTELEELFNSKKINEFNNISFPPNNGAIDIIKKT